MLIIDEAQNLPLPVLEQIRILSNLETDKEKLLQIILVGQLNLQTLLRSPEMRQLDQRVSIRYELKPLDGETVAAYVAHRLTIAGGGAAVGVHARRRSQQVHRWSGGIPRLINLICDRALLAAFSVRANRITPEMVTHAAESLDVQTPRARPLRLVHGARRRSSRPRPWCCCRRRWPSARRRYVYRAVRGRASRAIARAPERAAPPAPPPCRCRPRTSRAAPRAGVDRELPADAAFTILVELVSGRPRDHRRRRRRR